MTPKRKMSFRTINRIAFATIIGAIFLSTIFGISSGAFGKAFLDPMLFSSGSTYIGIGDPSPFSAVHHNFAIPTFAPIDVCTAPPLNMISWYRAEGNASDVFGAHDATLGGSVSTNGAGKVGNGFGFNGNGGFNTVSLGTWFNLQVFTVDMWVKPNPSQTTRAMIIDNNHTSFRSWEVQTLDGGATWLFGSADGSSSPIFFTLQPNVWQHLAVTRNASNVNTVYVNGVSVGTSTGTGPITYDGTQLLELGHWGGANGSDTRDFQGSQDEVEIFDRDLSQTEIQHIVDAGTAGKCLPPPTITTTGGALDFGNVTLGNTSPSKTYTVSGVSLTANLVITAPTDFVLATNPNGPFGPSVTLVPNASGGMGTTNIYVRYAPPSAGANTGNNITNVSAGATTQNLAVSGTGVAASCTAPPTGMVSWWKGDGNANDLLGANNGTFAAATYGTGKVGQAFSFDGSAEADIPNSASMQLQNFTIDAWVKQTAAAGATVLGFTNGGYELGLFGTSFPGGNVGGGVQQTGGLLLSTFGTTHVHSGSLVVPVDGNFHHVAVTKSGSTVVFYVDGVASAPATYNTTFTFTTNARIGTSFNGLIDEVEFFNTPLTQTQIQNIYNAGNAGKCTGTVTTTGTLNDFGSVTVGNTSAAQSYSVSGSNLTGNLTVIAPTGFQVSQSQFTGFTNTFDLTPSSGTVSLTPVWVRFAPTTAIVYSANVTNSGTNAAAQPVGVTGTGVAATCDTPPSGMVSWYPAEGNANDIFGANNGTLQNGATASGTGKVGQAFSFDGVDDYVSIPDMPDLEPANLTLDAWVNFASLDSTFVGNGAGTQRLIHKQNVRSGAEGDFASYELGKTRIGGLDKMYSCIASNAGHEICAIGSTTISAGQWYHVAATYDLQNLKVYVNGSLDGMTASTQPLDYATKPVTLGRTTDTSFDGSLNGLLDEVEIFSTALTAGDIAGIYNASTAGKCHVNHALTVNSTNGTVARSPDRGTQYLDGSTVQLTATPAANYSFVNWTGDISTSSNPTTVVMNGDKNITANFAANTFTLTYSAGANGLISGTTPQTVNSGGSGSAVTAVPNHGYHFVNWSDLSIANPRTDTNVTGNISVTANFAADVCATQPSGMISWYAAEGTALDRRGLNNGVPQGGATYAVGEVGQGFDFNGSSRSVLIGNSASLQPSTLSVDAWVFPRGAGSVNDALGGVIFSKDRGSVANSPISYGLFGLGNTGKFTAQLQFTDNSVSNIPSAGTYALNQWYHVAMTWDGSKVSLYVNGVLDTSSDQGAHTIVYSNDNAGLGAHSFGARFNNAIIDEVELFDRALTGQEVGNIYNASTAGKCFGGQPSTGLAGWWAGDGDARDITDNGNDGTLLNGAGFAVGKVGQTFDLNGTNQYVRIPDSPSLRPASVTLDTWVNPSINLPGGTFSIIGKSLGSGFFDSYQVFYENGMLQGIICDNSGEAPRVQFVTALNVNTWYHVAFTYDDPSHIQTLYLNGVAVATNSTGGKSPAYDTHPLLLGADTENGSEGAFAFPGRIDEADVFGRVLSANEIASIFDAGIAGKYKSVTPPTGSNVSSNAGGDATVTFTTVNTAGTTQQVPIDGNGYPALPGGQTSLGLYYDISSAASFTGNTTVCFHLPLVTTSTAFSHIRLDHFEGGIWVDRTNNGSIDFGTQTVCTVGLGSLSPFAIGAAAPSAADVNVSGRVLAPGGGGLRNASVVITDTHGTTRRVITNAFGYYTFSDVTVGGSYIIGVESRRFRYPTRVVQVSDTLADVDFSPQE